MSVVLKKKTIQLLFCFIFDYWKRSFPFISSRFVQYNGPIYFWTTTNATVLVSSLNHITSVFRGEGGLCFYNGEWCEHPDFRGWVGKLKDLCNQEFGYFKLPPFIEWHFFSRFFMGQLIAPIGRARMPHVATEISFDTDDFLCEFSVRFCQDVIYFYSKKK